MALWKAVSTLHVERFDRIAMQCDPFSWNSMDFALHVAVDGRVRDLVRPSSLAKLKLTFQIVCLSALI